MPNIEANICHVLFLGVILLFSFIIALIIHLVNNFNAYSMPNRVNWIEYLFVTRIEYSTNGYRFYTGIFIKSFYLSSLKRYF